MSRPAFRDAASPREGPSPPGTQSDNDHHPNRAWLLLEAGADPNVRGTHPCYQGRTALAGAVLHGNLTVAALLEAAGADATGIDAGTRMIGACLAPDRAALDALLAGDPDLLSAARDGHPDLVARAAELGRPDAVRLLIELGWDVNVRHRTTALHQAAWRGDTALVELLLDLGADPSIKDTEHDSTPAGWARYAGHDDLAALLDQA